MKKYFLILALLSSLQSCIFVAGAAAGAAAVAVVYDHRELSLILADQTLTNKAADALYANKDLAANSHITVTCFNKVILLTGEVSSATYHQMAEDTLKNIPNIKRIYNQTTIKGPTSSLTQASDAWITTKIKTQMLATKGLESSSIKVVTENGTVYLLGIVNKVQADAAVDIARNITGVQKVIRIFQYK